MSDPISEARELVKRYRGHGDTYVSTTNPKPLLDAIEALVEKCEAAAQTICSAEVSLKAANSKEHRACIKAWVFEEIQKLFLEAENDQE